MSDDVARQERLFELAQRKANVYAKSTLVPREYQGNIGNVLIAENMAKRMGADLLMVMQNLYVVHGKPGWSAQFLIATFNSCGRFSAIRYEFVGKSGTADYGCIAYATELSTGEVLKGTLVDMKMANAEGWVNKNGSKWKTMPEQMMRYRAATFFIRSTAPEIGMGLLTAEEIHDSTPASLPLPKPSQSLDDLSDRFAANLAGPSEQAEQSSEPADPVNYRVDFIQAAGVGFDDCKTAEAVNEYYESQTACADNDEERMQLTAMATAARKRVKATK